MKDLYIICVIMYVLLIVKGPTKVFLLMFLLKVFDQTIRLVKKTAKRKKIDVLKSLRYLKFAS